MDLQLNNKVALVLAASKGLGKAIATTLAAEGATVIIASRNAEELNRTAAIIEQQTGRKVTALPTDVSKAEDITHLIETTGQQFGQIDILINNAGGPPFGKFEDFGDLQWQQAFELNLLSFARTSRQVVPYMKKAGSGRIINVISGSVKSIFPNSVLSTSVRLGVVGMAKLLSEELGIYNITVNNVGAGLILTDRVKETLSPDRDADEQIKEKVKAIPLGRIGKPEEFAAVVAFLASAQASYVTGTTLQIDGGAGRNII